MMSRFLARVAAACADPRALVGKAVRGALVAAALLLCPQAPAAAEAPQSLQIKVLSNRPDLLSGGDALVEIVLPAAADMRSLKVILGTRDVTSSFARRADGRVLGRVEGMAEGANRLTVSVGRGPTTSAVLINHRVGGPILYGPQVTPWACEPGATDGQCDRPTTYAYFYRAAADREDAPLKPYDPGKPVANVATTTTDAGLTVPFIVRVETGVLDRDFYKIAVLYAPSADWRPWAPQAGWNRKVLYTHGAGMGFGHGQMSAPLEGRVLDTVALARGYAVATTALNDTGHNANLAVQAEAMMMLREHIIETYGEIRYAIGYGGSGGALAQSWVANAYPGLYDGIIVAASFPDAGSTTIEVTDCGLLNHYIAHPTAWADDVRWSAAQVRAVTGTQGDVCGDWGNNTRPPPLSQGVDVGYTQYAQPSHQSLVNFPGVAPTAIGGCDVPVDQVYRRTLNPRGVRCTPQDYAIGIFGRRADDGFAGRPYSNVGVQYGLAALNSGAISPAQFVDLNSKIGGYDIDLEHRATRSQADPEAVTAAYRSGWVNSANGLAGIPVLDLRNPDTSGIHHQYRSWVMRARLEKAQGHHRNQVIWFGTAKQERDALDAMDRWVAAIKADRSNRDAPAKVVADRPPGLTDLCGARDGTALTMEQCTGVADASARIVAGGPPTDDVVQCQLKPLDRGAYKVRFSDAQWARLQEVFAAGVCDYAQQGVAQQPTAPWRTYLNADGSVRYGGAALPASAAIRAAP